jgi:Holliday junction resolvase RusA-like endonuclease
VVGGQVRVFSTHKAKRYKEVVASALVGCGKIVGPVSVSLRVFRPRKIGDLDNLLKVLLDSLKGYAFEDDKQVVEIQAVRFDDKENPRVEVGIRPAA